MEIGQSIRTLRKKINLTQGVFASCIGVTQPYLSGIEKGNKKPSLEVLEKISKALGVPLPVMFWFGVDREDVAEEKKHIYDMLKPSIDNLINDIFC